MRRMHLYRMLFSLLITAGSLLPATVHADEQPLLSDDASIFLVTCSPGEELYERYGHTALCVSDENVLDMYNYGLFDFNTPHFYWRFVRGETYYQLGKEDAKWFMSSYTYAGRTVNVQELRLSQEDKEAIYRALLKNYRPENRVYLYNFVFDNCATRPYHLLMDALTANTADSLLPVSSTYEGAEGVTYRTFIRRYTPKGSWSDLGINLLFGPKADQPMKGEQRLFLPEELMYYIQGAHYADGSPLVDYSSIKPFDVERVPWYKTWYFGLTLLFIALALLSYYDRKRGKRTRWVDYSLYSIYALLMVLVTFLTFFSIHPLVGYGPYLLIIPTIHLCARIIYLWQS